MSTDNMEDAVIDWSMITTDMLGNSIDATMLDELSIIRFPRLSEEEVLLGINNETLKQSDLPTPSFLTTVQTLNQKSFPIYGLGNLPASFAANALQTSH